VSAESDFGFESQEGQAIPRSLLRLRIPLLFLHTSQLAARVVDLQEKNAASVIFLYITA
jgi:hypothetical protein